MTVAEGYTMAVQNITLIVHLLSLGALVIAASCTLLLAYFAYRIYSLLSHGGGVGGPPTFVDHFAGPFNATMPFFHQDSVGNMNRHSFAVVDNPEPARCSQPPVDDAAAAAAASSSERSSSCKEEEEESCLRTLQPCIVCKEEEASFIIIPCNHIGMCKACTEKMQEMHMAKCPLCRGVIMKCERVHFA